MVGKRLLADEKSLEDEHKERKPCMVERHTLKEK